MLVLLALLGNGGSEVRVMKRAIISFLLLLVAELAASSAVWHGTPTDWAGERLRFWTFEGSRLGYWGVFLLISAVLWIGLRYLSSRTSVRNVLAGTCCIAVEIATSLTFWKHLSPGQAVYLGWWDLSRYALEHLVVWALVCSFGSGVWYFLRRPTLKPVSGTMKRKF